MEAAVLAIGVVALADVCIKYTSIWIFQLSELSDKINRLGSSVIAMYKIYNDPHTEIGDAILRIQHHWKMIEIETGVLRNLSHLLADDDWLHLNMLFQRLM
jgi:hypothetical protein